MEITFKSGGRDSKSKAHLMLIKAVIENNPKAVIAVFSVGNKVLKITKDNYLEYIKSKTT